MVKPYAGTSLKKTTKKTFLFFVTIFQNRDKSTIWCVNVAARASTELSDQFILTAIWSRIMSWLIDLSSRDHASSRERACVWLQFRNYPKNCEAVKCWKVSSVVHAFIDGQVNDHMAAVSQVCREALIWQLCDSSHTLSRSHTQQVLTSFLLAFISSPLMCQASGQKSRTHSPGVQKDTSPCLSVCLSLFTFSLVLIVVLNLLLGDHHIHGSAERESRRWRRKKCD